MINGMPNDMEYCDFTMMDNSSYDRYYAAVNKEVPTDIIEGDIQDLWAFIKLWNDTIEPLDEKKFDFKFELLPTPGDIVREKTIPIMSTKLVIKDRDYIGGAISAEIVITNNGLDEAAECIDSTCIIGWINLSEVGVAFPLIYMNKSSCIVVPSAYYILSNIPYKIAQSGAFTSHLDMDELYPVTMISLSIWYGIQISLLHPITKNVFGRPKSEKLSRKDILKQGPGTATRPKVKYVRHHFIGEENSIKTAVQEAVIEKSSGKCYDRHKLLWRVIGHWRTMGDKKVWIKPHWRGPLKDTHTGSDIDMNRRIVDITEEAKDKMKSR